MTPSHSLTHSSIDFTDDNPFSINGLSPNPPPRLQHSPSLPNIRSSPSADEDSETHLAPPPPLTPTPVVVETLPPNRNSNPGSKLLEHRGSLSLEDLGSYHVRRQPPKTRRRHRDPAYPLLTPPLTPSSSLRTTASMDSTKDKEKFIAECPDKRSSRFLRVNNLSKQVSGDTVAASIVEALASSKRLSESTLKGIFVRDYQLTGTVILAFWDVRDAEVAQRIIPSGSTGPLAQCVGDEKSENGSETRIYTQFLTPQEITKIVGNSAFLLSMDSTFYLTVEPSQTEDLKLGIRSNDEDEPDSNEDPVNIQDVLNNSVIKVPEVYAFLKSFGDIRSVEPVDNFQQQTKKVFHIEYYDVRVARTAYESIHGKIVSGMKLTVSGREDAPLRAEPQSHNVRSLSSNDSGCDSLPLPPPVIYPSDAAIFGPPGHHSQMRERFKGSENPESKQVFTSSQPLPSPPFFYESYPGANDVTTAQPHVLGIVSRDTPGNLYQAVPELKTEAGSLDSECKIPYYHQWRNESLPVPSPGLYGLHQDCYYCPSRRPPPCQTTTHCYASTPGPFYYFPDQNHPAHGIHLAPFIPGPQKHLQVIHSSWPLEPMAMVAPQPPAGDHFIYDPQALPRPATYCSSQIPNPVASTAAYPVLPISPEGPVPDATDLGQASRTSRPHPRNRCLALNGVTSSKDPSVTPERNQLNLARIEDGQDTRTTVMIKNIPNKMTDKDLIAYIGKVCPRKIDFLYLRMDFQNGCNVGYAFVNFITVQDLLHFAKSKLGEKWNMFSSEKVLQMSYANYQGKEALVEKFKNSCIMDEREAWRPKIFYSEPGPEQGLPEPFPPPTHYRRKERSSFNRGALYVPGVNRNLGMSSQGPRRHVPDEQRASYSEH